MTLLQLLGLLRRQLRSRRTPVNPELGRGEVSFSDRLSPELLRYLWRVGPGYPTAQRTQALAEF